MPRSPRVVAPGGVFHVAPRGNDGRAIFETEEDRVRHLMLLTRVTRKYGWTVLSYCQMTNHFHLLLQIGEGGLSEGMQELLGKYARYWNAEHGHTGHLFRNRFKSVAVLSDRQLIVNARYIDLNPVRPTMKFRPEQWHWSSYRAHLGLDHAPPFLATSEFLRRFGPTPKVARNVYRRFVQEGLVSRSHGSVSDTEV
jgi:putative transposase